MGKTVVFAFIFFLINGIKFIQKAQSQSIFISS